MGIALARSELERPQRTARIITKGAMRTTPTKVLEMFVDLPPLETTVEVAALVAANCLPRRNPTILEIGITGSG